MFKRTSVLSIYIHILGNASIICYILSFIIRKHLLLLLLLSTLHVLSFELLVKNIY